MLVISYSLHANLNLHTHSLRLNFIHVTCQLTFKLKSQYLPELLTLHDECTWLKTKFGMDEKKGTTLDSPT